jgi:tetratricopeptide (TPR) repeat protein
MKRWIILIIAIVPILSNAQIASKIKATHEVFDNLIQAYANGKGAPDLKIVPLKGRQVIAEYATLKGFPVIRIDEKLINLCFSLGKDSLNALAFILSHELSHYYKDDNWCMDYAEFKFKTNPALAKDMKTSSKYNKGKEAAADKEGIIYASIAGYSPSLIFNSLLDKIYIKYSLTDNLLGYPSKNDRKLINKDASKEAETWFLIYNTGVILTYSGRYSEAVDCFNYLTTKFPSREVFNNLGTAQLLWAIKNKPKSAVEYIYPIEIDPQSRLSLVSSIDRDINSNKLFEKLLNEALQNFEKSRQIDPKYKKAIVNLACVYDLQENFDLAIGYTKKIDSNDHEYLNALTIRGIAAAHDNRYSEAKKCFTEIQQKTNNSKSYNHNMLDLSNYDLMDSEKYKKNWLNDIKVDTNSNSIILDEIKEFRDKRKAYDFRIHKIGEFIKSISYKYSNKLNEYFIETNDDKILLFKYLIDDNKSEKSKTFSIISVIENRVKFLKIIEKT